MSRWQVGGYAFATRWEALRAIFTFHKPDEWGICLQCGRGGLGRGRRYRILGRRIFLGARAWTGCYGWPGGPEDKRGRAA